MLKNTLLTLLGVGIGFWLGYFSPIIILNYTYGRVSEICENRGWSDWYGVYRRFGIEILICDIRN